MVAFMMGESTKKGRTPSQKKSEGYSTMAVLKKDLCEEFVCFPGARVILLRYSNFSLL
jgi:hypothetical protein